MTAVASVSTADENRWQVADRSALWEPARVVGVERSQSATTQRLRLAQVPEVVAGQYYLFRLPIDGPPGAVQQAYSLSSSPFPPSPDIEITVREVRGGRVSPLLARRVQVGDVLGCAVRSASLPGPNRTAGRSA